MRLPWADLNVRPVGAGVMRLYRSVGPRDIAARVAGSPPGTIVTSADDMVRWASHHRPTNERSGRITATFRAAGFRAGPGSQGFTSPWAFLLGPFGADARVKSGGPSRELANPTTCALALVGLTTRGVARPTLHFAAPTCERARLSPNRARRFCKPRAAAHVRWSQRFPSKIAGCTVCPRSSPGPARQPFHGQHDEATMIVRAGRGVIDTAIGPCSTTTAGWQSRALGVRVSSTCWHGRGQAASRMSWLWSLTAGRRNSRGFDAGTRGAAARCTGSSSYSSGCSSLRDAGSWCSWWRHPCWTGGRTTAVCRLPASCSTDGLRSARTPMLLSRTESHARNRGRGTNRRSEILAAHLLWRSWLFWADF